MIFVTIWNPNLKVSLVSYVTIFDERRIKVGKEIEVGFDFFARGGFRATM